MTRFLAGVVVAGLTLLGCSDDDDASTSTTAALETVPSDDSTTTATTAESTTTTTAEPATTTTAEPATTTTVPPEGSTLPTVPEDYASALIDAWMEGDATFAHELATDEAFDTLFAFESGGPDAGWTLQGCEGAAGSSFCTFNAGGDPTVIVRVGNEAASLGQPQAVTEVRVEG